MSHKSQAEIASDIVVALVTSKKGPSLDSEDAAKAFRIIFEAVCNPALKKEE